MKCRFDEGTLRSPAAYTLFLRSARWTTATGVFFFLFFIPAVIASAELGFAQLIPKPALVLPMVLFAVPAAAAGAIILFGMFAYLLTCDRSSTKAFWIAVFLVCAWYGAAVYFFKVYRKENQPAALE
jgi:hypothetical protein